MCILSRTSVLSFSGTLRPRSALVADTRPVPTARSTACCSTAPVRHVPHAGDRQAYESLAVTAEADRLAAMLGARMPNSLLLEGGAGLPVLYGRGSALHWLNCTNGLELAPLLDALALPFNVCRLRSTCLEQQRLEAFASELDASLLLAAALGHTCVVWDCGCRSRTNGAPRALWYGLEFARFALRRFWLGPEAAGPAHLRGHSVAREFEAACANFSEPSKRRLRYYARFVTAAVAAAGGPRLVGAFRRTDHDEDVDFFVEHAVTHCGPGTAVGFGAQLGGVDGVTQRQQQQHQQQQMPAGLSELLLLQTHAPGASSSSSNSTVTGRLGKADLLAYKWLAEEQDMGLLSAGFSHAEFAAWKQQQQ